MSYIRLPCFCLTARANFSIASGAAQAELLLPTLDGIRLDLCGYLTRLYGTDWPVKWFQPEHPRDEAAVRENSLACEWGYLDLAGQELFCFATRASMAAAHYTGIRCSQRDCPLPDRLSQRVRRSAGAIQAICRGSVRLDVDRSTDLNHVTGFNI